MPMATWFIGLIRKIMSAGNLNCASLDFMKYVFRQEE